MPMVRASVSQWRIGCGSWKGEEARSTFSKRDGSSLKGWKRYDEVSRMCETVLHVWVRSGLSWVSARWSKL